MATNDIIVSKENASAQFNEHVLTIDDLNLDLSSPPPIGNTTPNTGGFTSLTASGDITADGAYNVGMRMFSTAANRTTFGHMTVPAAHYFSVRTDGNIANSAGAFGFSNSASSSEGTIDTRLTRSSAGVLSVDGAASGDGLGSVLLTNLTASGNLLQYNVDNGANYERAALKWDANAFTIATENAGTGAARDIVLAPASGKSVMIGAGDTASKFSIVGNFQLYTAFFYNSTAHGIYVRAGETSSHYSLRVLSKSLAQLFVVKGDGNVGIGTATPAEKLDVVGNIEASGDDGNNGIVLTSPDGNRKLITVANDGTLVVVAA